METGKMPVLRFPSRALMNAIKSRIAYAEKLTVMFSEQLVMCQ